MGWLRDMFFTSTFRQSAKPRLKQRNVWGVDPETAPDGAEQVAEPPVHETVPPEVRCLRVESHISGDGTRLVLWIGLTNAADTEVEIVRIDCVGQTTNPSRFLRPGETHEIEVYRGPVFTNDDANMAQVTYKSLPSGEYYRADYFVKYTYTRHEGSEQYTPYELDLHKPIKKL